MRGLNRRGVGVVATASLVAGILISGLGLIAIGAALIPFLFGLTTLVLMRGNPKATTYASMTALAIGIIAALGNLNPP